MEQRLTVFAKSGDPIAELDAAVNASWVQGEVGSLEFSISTRDPKFSQRNLQFGNLILFESDLLPAWGGLIWPPRFWQPGQLTVQARSAEFQFTRRILNGGGRMPAGGRKLTGTAASLFAQLIELGNQQADLRIEPGTLVEAGEPLSVELRQQSLWEALKELETNSGQEWWLEPERDADNRLLFKAHWAPVRGRQRNYALLEGKHLALIGRAAEAGDLLNRVLVLGEGETQKPSSLAIDARSQALYGPTFFAEFVETADQAVLNARAKELLRQHAQPRLRFQARVLGEPALKQLRLGDSYPIVLESAAFSAGTAPFRARLLAMEYQSAQNALKAVFEQILDLE